MLPNNFEILKQNFNTFLLLKKPILLYGTVPYELFHLLLPNNHFYVDIREIESVTSLDSSLINNNICVFSNVDYNKSILSFLRQFDCTFIITSSTFIDFGLPLFVEYSFEEFNFSNFIKNNINLCSIKEDNLTKIKMFKNRTSNIKHLDLDNRILLYNSLQEIFSIDLINELYLTREMIFNYKKTNVKPYIINSNYFFSKENINLLYEILENIKYKENVILFGETGTGKTSLIEFLAKKMNKELNIINISSDTEISDFLGRFVISNNEIIYQEGFLLKALKKNCWLLLDEINLAPKEVLDFLDSVMSKRSVFVENKIIEFHSDFLIFGCMNLNDVGKKDFKNVNFLRKEVVNTEEDIPGLQNIYNPNDNLNNLLPFTNKREYTRALILLRKKYPIEIVKSLIFNLKSQAKQEKKIKIELENYIITDYNHDVINRVELAIETGLPVLLEGDTSTGKTSLIVALAKKYNKKLYRINNHEQTEASDYFGIKEQGNLIKEGILDLAIRNGDWILLDELNLAPSEVLEVLNRVLDTNYKEFRLFATQNLGYSGRNLLSKAFISRFIKIDFIQKNFDELKKILCFRFPNQYNGKIISIYQKLKLKRNYNELITLRDCFRWSKRIKNKEDVYLKGMMMVYERQRGIDRRVIKEVFDEIGEGYSNYIKSIDFVCNELNFFLSDSHKKLINLILDAWKYKEPVLLVGETGIGKSRVIEIACKIRNIKYLTVSMNGNTDNSDFIGSFAINNKNIEWSDGPLLKAMKEGFVLILDEINLAENSVIERLNSVLEDERSLFIPELNQEIKAHENFLVIASMNPSTDVGKKELSLALKNRFTEFFFELTNEEKRAISTKILEGFLSNDIIEKNLVDKEISLRSIELTRDFLRNNTEHDKSFINIEEMKDINCELINTNSFFGIEPFVYKKINEIEYDFSTKNVKKNLFYFLRAMSLKRPILLEGDCGSGKTSFIIELAKILGKKVFRFNLSDSTEMSDLIGTFIPSEDGILFKEGVISVIRDGHWLLLDEINLCSQSILEGLNSLLDFRRKFCSTYLSFEMHEESLIIGTMNQSSIRNKRNPLPRSFIDRFINLNFIIEKSDIFEIIKNLGFKYYKGTLRYNLLANKINKDYYNTKGNHFKGKLDERKFKKDFIPLYSQLNDLDTFIKCYEKKIPVILIGPAKNNFIKILNEYKEIYCHEEIDITDLIGLYVKQDNKFLWKDSELISSLKSKKTIYINSADLVDKTILDRLTCLLEDKITIHEHLNEEIQNDSFIIFGCDEGLSPALEDRSVVIKPSLILNNLDIYKIFNCQSITENPKDEIEKIFQFYEIFNLKQICINSILFTYQLIHLDLLKYKLLNEIPEYLKYNYPTEIKLKEIEFDYKEKKLINFYLNNCFFFNKVNGLKEEINELKNTKSDGFNKVNFIRRTLELKETPLGIIELKRYVIKENLNDLKESLLEINYEVDLIFEEDFNDLLNLNVDPLSLKKDKLYFDLIEFYNGKRQILVDYFTTMNEGGVTSCDAESIVFTLKSLLKEYENVKPRENYGSFIFKLREFDNSLKDNSTMKGLQSTNNEYDNNNSEYGTNNSEYGTNNSEYNTNKRLTFFNENIEFEDMICYYMLSLLKEKQIKGKECGNCVYFDDHFKCLKSKYLINQHDVILTLLEDQVIENIKEINLNDLLPEISKHLCNILMFKPVDSFNLIYEMVVNDYVIRSNIPFKKRVLSHKIINECLLRSTKLEKKDFKFELILFLRKFSFDEIRKYLLDTKFYELKERIYFLKVFINYKLKNLNELTIDLSYLSMLYNNALLYSLFADLKEDRNVYTLSLLSKEINFNYKKRKGCLCSLSQKKNYYSQIKNINFEGICFCNTNMIKEKIELNDLFYFRMPNELFSLSERLIAYLYIRSEKLNIKDRWIVGYSMFLGDKAALEMVLNYLDGKTVTEVVVGDFKENIEFNEENNSEEINNQEDISEEVSKENRDSDVESESDDLLEEENNSENAIEEENATEEEEIAVEEEIKEYNEENSELDFELEEERSISHEVEEETMSEDLSGEEKSIDEEIEKIKESENVLNEENELLFNEREEEQETKQEINNNQTCKEADNYFSKVEEEKEGLQIRKEDIFMKIKNCLPDNKRNKYRGNYKTGKKINMRKIVEFFMSNYEKDKIFLRRNKEGKKDYNINIYIDNSKSMKKYGIEEKVKELLNLLVECFEKLDLKYKVFIFGEDTKMFDNFDFQFDELKSNLEIKDDSYNLVLTDGVIKTSFNRNTLFLLLNKELKDMKQVVFDGEMKIINYLDTIQSKYCLVDENNFLDEFGIALQEVFRDY